jgi:mono/diheme cytochrome c family protein
MKSDPVGPRHPLFHRILLVLALLPGWAGSAAAEDGEDLRLYLQGRFVFERNCVACHGKTGRGNGVLAVGVKDIPRNLRSGIFKFRSTPMGFLPTDEDLARTIRRGIASTMMPTFETTLNKADLHAVIAYVKSLSPRWRKAEFKGKPVEIPPPPGWIGKPEEAAPHLADAKVFFTATCAICHGPEGKGDGPGGKDLKDAWDHPLTPADLTGEHHKSGDTLIDLYRTISLGLDGTPMVGYLETLGNEKIWELAAFVQSLSKPNQSANGRPD